MFYAIHDHPYPGMHNFRPFDCVLQVNTAHNKTCVDHRAITTATRLQMLPMLSGGHLQLAAGKIGIAVVLKGLRAQPIVH